MEITCGMGIWRERGRSGEKHTTFSDLTAYSTPLDIEKSVLAATAYARKGVEKDYPIGSVADEQSVREAVKMAITLYAKEYVEGLKEREAAHE